MATTLQIDSKLPLFGLGTALLVAAGYYYGLDTRVAVLSTKAAAMEKIVDEQIEVTKGVTAALTGFEKVVVKFDGRLEKIEYRLGEVEKRLARLEPPVRVP